jgi:GH24 family phage-related lysozyme (muramidase)
MDLYKIADKIFYLDEGDGPPGLPGRPYLDTQGIWTIGRGHRIGHSLTELKLSPNVIQELFREDLAVAIRDAREVVGPIFFDSLTPARQMALITMLFTLGQNKFHLFQPTIDAMRREDWDEVSQHILLSKWARDVDPPHIPDKGRDDRVAYMFRTGDFHPYYGIIG